MSAYPVLDTLGAVRFSDRASAGGSWETTLGRGVLVVRPEMTLTAMSTLNVRVEIPGLSPMSLRVEVVGLNADRAMLRLLDGPIPKPISLDDVPNNPFAAAIRPPSRAFGAVNPFSSNRTPSVKVGATAGDVDDDDVMPAPDFSAPTNPRTGNAEASGPIPRAPLPLRAETSGPVVASSTSPAMVPPQLVSQDGPNPTAENQASPASSLLSPPAGTTGDDSVPTVVPTIVPMVAPTVAPTLGRATLSVTASTSAEEALPFIEPAPRREGSGAVAAFVFGEAQPPPSVDDEKNVPSSSLTASPSLSTSVSAVEEPAVEEPTVEAPAPAAVEPPVPAPVAPGGSSGFREQPGSLAGLPAMVSTSKPSLATGEAQSDDAEDEDEDDDEDDDAPDPTATARLDLGGLRGGLPPYFTGDTIRFASLQAFRDARAEILGVGAVLAVTDGAPPRGEVSVRLAAGSSECRTRIPATFVSATPGTVVMQPNDVATLHLALAELDPETAQAPTPSSRLGLQTMNFPDEGTLYNPTSVAGILGMPIHRPVTEEHLKRASVPLFLRWLRTTKGIFRLEMQSDGQPVHTLIIVDGREVRSPVSLATVSKSLVSPTVAYQLHPLKRAPPMTNTGRTLHLIVEVVRSMLSQHDPAAIAAAFPHTADTRLVRADDGIVEALGFAGSLARMVRTNMQGDETILEISKAATGSRTAWDVLVCLELFGGLTFLAESGRSEDATIGVAAPSGSRPAILGKDHFAVLGLHWSCAPDAIYPAYQQAKREYGNNGPKRPVKADDARAVAARIEEAFRALNDATTRQAYRRATFNMVWPHQAQLLVQQAKLAMYRKDIGEARDLLHAAEDMASSVEAKAILKALEKSP